MKDPIVYSTDKDFRPEEDSKTEETPSKSTELRLSLDRKLRAGKAVTVIDGFRESREELADISRTLKSLCATGGTVKDRTLELQGDHRNRVETWLKKQGYRIKRVGG